MRPASQAETPLRTGPGPESEVRAPLGPSRRTDFREEAHLSPAHPVQTSTEGFASALPTHLHQVPDQTRDHGLRIREILITPNSPGVMFSGHSKPDVV